MKNAFDFIVSSLGLILLFPLFIILSLLIIFEDKGPFLFKQMRVGKGGRMFILYKFRSMRISESWNENSFEPGNTNRVTHVGKFIRKTKLDELPQLINVIKGDMSLVGPRPEMKEWVEAFPAKWKVIHSVKPGITDVASLEFRNEESILAGYEDPVNAYKNIILPRKLELYEKYVSDHTFLGDLKILYKTLFMIILKK
jgi:lipopolysaccharide/colanic/teichoic acid biosynthesis glycosyltransferase